MNLHEDLFYSVANYVKAEMETNEQTRNMGANGRGEFRYNYHQR